MHTKNVTSQIKFWRQDLIDGKPLRTLPTTLNSKVFRGSRLTAVSDGKKARDWAIHSQDPKAVIDKAMGKVQRLDSFGF